MTGQELVLVLASANPDKSREMAQILAAALPPELVVRSRPEELPPVEETGETLEQNARLKATSVRAATGLGAIADDTGLEVAALGGRPGVRSARYAGEHATADENIELLLHELEGVTDRRARFRTIALAALADGTELVASGTIDGRIDDRRRGSGGFGYDPVFVPDGPDGRALAELTAEDKHAISHRGKAMRALAVEIVAYLERADASRGN